MKEKIEKIKSAHFEKIVGKEVYDSWIQMLKELVPRGRTHRLSVVVAAMLQFTLTRAHASDDDNPLCEALIFAFEKYDPEESYEITAAVAEKIFQDADLNPNRTNSKGHGYSITESAAHEFLNWSNMPWE